MKVNSPSGDRLFGGVPKCFGDLDCIFSLLGKDQMYGIMNISRGKVG